MKEVTLKEPVYPGTSPNTHRPVFSMPVLMFNSKALKQMHIHKISIRLLFSIFILGTVTACDSDFLDKNPLNSVSGEIFWKTESDVRTALAGVYSRLQQNFLGYERVYFDGLTDN